MKKKLKQNLPDAHRFNKSDHSLTKTDSLCLKGVAMILMIFHHCFRTPSLFENFTVDFSPFSQDLVVDVSSYFKICVSIFAFITGYGLYLSASKNVTDVKSSAKWTISRLIKTMSGFWFIYILVFIITQVFAGYPVEVYCDDGMIRGAVYAVIDFLGLSNAIGTPSLDSTWWYMSAAIFFIIVIPVFIKISEKWGYFTLLPMLVLLPRVLNIEFPGGDSPYSFVTIMVMGMFFAKFNVFERLANLKWIKSEKADKAVKFIPALIILVISFILFDRVYRSKFWELHYTIIPLIFIYFFKEYIIRIPVVKQVLFFFGEALNEYIFDSYDILIHVFQRFYVFI